MTLRVPSPPNLAPARPLAVAETFPRHEATNQTALASGVASCFILPVQGQLNSSGMVVNVSGTAKATGTHGWFALLDPFGSVLAVTADQTDAATTFQSNEQSLPWIGGFYGNYPTPTGLYLAVMVAAGTPPQLAARPGLAANMSGGPPIIAGTFGSGLTTPPVLGSTISLASNGATAFHGYIF